MEDKKEEQQQPPIIDQLKEYAETRIKLAKYQAVDSSTAVIGSIVADIALLVCVILLFLFATVTLGFYLAEVLGSVWQGFGCITLLYLIIVIILKFKRHDLGKGVASALIQKILN